MGLLNPLVSIIIPCYNYGRYLGEAIESALNQTYRPLEIIVINDGSQDNTVEIASAYASKHKEIKFVNNKHQGLAHTFNKGIRMVTSEYIIFLSADDKLHPTYVEKTLKILLANPEISFVYTDMILFGDQRKVIKPPEYSLNRLKEAYFIHGSSLMRKSAFLETDGFDPTLPYALDRDLWLSFAKKGLYGKLLPEPLLFYRKHGLSKSSVSAGVLWRTQRQIREKHRWLYTPLERKLLNIDDSLLHGRLILGWHRLKVSSLPLGSQRRHFYDICVDQIRQLVYTAVKRLFKSRRV